MDKSRYYAWFMGELTQLAEGTVTKIDPKFHIMHVKIEKTSVNGTLTVLIPYNLGGMLAPVTRPLGFGVDCGLEGSALELKGDLQKLPKVGSKVLMHLLFTGTDGFRCVAWTHKALVEAVSVISALSYSKIKAVKLTNK